MKGVFVGYVAGGLMVRRLAAPLGFWASADGGLLACSGVCGAGVGDSWPGGGRSFFEERGHAVICPFPTR